MLTTEQKVTIGMIVVMLLILLGTNQYPKNNPPQYTKNEKALMFQLSKANAEIENLNYQIRQCRFLYTGK